jgi:hypothetical protein
LRAYLALPLEKQHVDILQQLISAGDLLESEGHCETSTVPVSLTICSSVARQMHLSDAPLTSVPMLGITQLIAYQDVLTVGNVS